MKNLGGRRADWRPIASAYMFTTADMIGDNFVPYNKRTYKRKTYRQNARKMKAR